MSTIQGSPELPNIQPLDIGAGKNSDQVQQGKMAGHTVKLSSTLSKLKSFRSGPQSINNSTPQATPPSISGANQTSAPTPASQFFKEKFPTKMTQVEKREMRENFQQGLEQQHSANVMQSYIEKKESIMAKHKRQLENEIVKKDIPLLKDFVSKDLGDICEEPLLFAKIQEQAKIEFSSENVEFLGDLIRLRSTQDPQEAQKLAQNMLDPKYANNVTNVNFDTKQLSSAMTLLQDLASSAKLPTNNHLEVIKKLEGALKLNIADTHKRAKDKVAGELKTAEDYLKQNPVSSEAIIKSARGEIDQLEKEMVMQSRKNKFQA